MRGSATVTSFAMRARPAPFRMRKYETAFDARELKKVLRPASFGPALSSRTPSSHDPITRAASPRVPADEKEKMRKVG
ncbi:hypothetical protein EVAR_41926_1 [Eumeta japonica]|uniref:Uncharacterized protein n=1 Tax=Eumeta variegata TaxID=151549 RepID=A0A4C1XIT6_EUMVA|nr:hypothetical protein EVAR_41926_1 [Eumeta japonica]